MPKSEAKRRRLHGGLYNAIRQAEQRGFNDMLIVDADCHQQEPFDTFAKYCEEPYRKFMLAKDTEVDPWLAKSASHHRGATIDHVQFAPKGVQLLKRPETTYPRYQEAKEVIDVFSTVMADIGIKRSIVLPNFLLQLPMAKPEFEVAISRGYTEYMIQNILDKSRSVVTLLSVPSKSPIKAAEMIDDYGSEKGIVGVMISAVTPRLAGIGDFDPIYQAAQRKHLPVCFHGATGRGIINMGLEDMEFIGAHALGFPISIIRHLTSLILSGVPVRFPNLDFVFMEGGVTWIPWLMNRLDDEYVKRRIEAPLLTKFPSEYMKKFYFTSQPLEQAHMEELEHVFDLMDAENHLVYASDYPHWDFDLPSVIFDLPFLSDKAKRKILGENAVKVFNMN